MPEQTANQQTVALAVHQVAASKASTIIVLHPDSASSAANAEAIKAAVVMSIEALGPQAGQRVVVQMTGGCDSSQRYHWQDLASQLWLCKFVQGVPVVVFPAGLQIQPVLNHA